MSNTRYDIIIIGGGLAGLTCALHLSQSDLRILLIEKSNYPHHKVCGEYVSNEVLPYLNSLGIDPLAEGAVSISKFELSNQKGKSIKSSLPLGGFGMSRYAFDHLFYKKLEKEIDILIDSAETVNFEQDQFYIFTKRKKTYTAEFVVGAFGKRSNIDISMKRSFVSTRTSWMAIKSHYHCDFPNDLVALHTFKGGYCGLSKTESNAVNMCCLIDHAVFKNYTGINDFQKEVMGANPKLKAFFSEGKPLSEKPMSISQISFQNKKPVENHVIMLGDSAGLIHPLCGNGMAMAIHSAKLFSEVFLRHKTDRKSIESEYSAAWELMFSNRLKAGKHIQKVLLHPTLSSIGFSVGQLFPSLLPRIIKKTHGTIIE